MLNYQTLISVTEVLLATIPILLIVAFVTIAERKTMGSMQRRLGPNATPRVVSLQSGSSFLSGLCLIICSKDFNEWLYNLINSLDKDFCLQYCLNILKEVSKIDLMQQSSILSLISSSVSFMTFCVTDLTFYDHLFSLEFLNLHASLYGTNFPPDYYNILSDLHINYDDLYIINSQLHHNYNQLMDFFTYSMETDFLRAYFASNDVVNNVILNEEFESRLETFNNLRLRFWTNYNNYRLVINTVNDTIQQLRSWNPNLAVPFPPFNPIRVTPIEWFILDATTDGTVDLDPIIFQYDNLTDGARERLNDIAASVNREPLFLVDNILLPYNLVSQNLSTLPFDSFATPDYINIFDIETEQRRSRARTRAAYRELPDQVTPMRSRSRSRPRSD